MDLSDECKGSCIQRELFHSFLETICVIIRLNSRYCWLPTEKVSAGFHVDTHFPLWISPPEGKSYTFFWNSFSFFSSHLRWVLGIRLQLSGVCHINSSVTFKNSHRCQILWPILFLRIFVLKFEKCCPNSHWGLCDLFINLAIKW